MKDETKAKRDLLKELSNIVKPEVKQGKFSTVNEALIELFYKKGEDQEFKQFYQWKREGMSVKKGSKAFLIWARPTTKQQEEQGQEPTPDDYSFFPMCYLFSNAQVEGGKL